MDVTFDLNLKLVRGELAWLEDQVKTICGVVAEEKSNKKLYIKGVLGSLLLANELLIQASILDLGALGSHFRWDKLMQLIDQLPPKSEAAGKILERNELEAE
ncbi:MAG: hypothetical protein M2R45_00514 [Verrucomicrobia subdivision 3 bacterium]|nr:hypothetical protein [Limisphaerales bacterium]MCS1413609.1 hypothetical protein [Limisphaerales bacterium]